MAQKEQAPVLGVDLGGTKIFAGLAASATSTQPLLAQVKVATEGRTDRDRILANLFGAIDGVLAQAGRSVRGIGGLGVCVPGVVVAAEGRVVNCTNLAGWNDVPLKAILEERYGVPVSVDNDARAACWAEATTGAGAGVATQAFVTVSTGIGAAFVLDGRLYRGVNAVAGEVGETRWPTGETVETTAAGPALDRLFGVKAEDLKARYEAGDPAARRAFSHLVNHLGLVLANLTSVIDPGLIVVGGGVANLGRFLLDPLEEEVRRQAYSLSSRVTLVQARWMGEAGVRGMMALTST
jgi:glucokinase